MIFYDKESIKPVEVDSSGGFFGVSFAFLGPRMARTELWHCFFCGEVRAGLQAKRGTFLHHVRKFPLHKPDDVTLADFQRQYNDAFDATSPLLSLADGWKFVIKETGREECPKIWMLACANCYAAQREEDS